MTYTDEQLRELAEKRYGTDIHLFAQQRDGFIEGYKAALKQANGDDTKQKPALRKHIVSRWAYFYDNQKPILLGFAAAMILNVTYKLIDTIVIKIALILTGS